MNERRCEWCRGGLEVVYCGGRRLPSRDVVDDALVHVSRPRTTDPARCIGAKPAAFAWWLFGLLDARPGDELVDLFPGSGGIGRAWARYTSTQALDDASLGDLRDASASAEPDSSGSSTGHASRLDRARRAA